MRLHVRSSAARVARQLAGGSTDGSHRLDQLDGLRGVACLLVIAYHLEWSVALGGMFTVDVFLVLSGFLITGVLLGEWRARGTVSIRRFYARRILRLYPALVALLVVLTPFGLLLTLGQTWQDWFVACGAALTYTTTLIPLVPDFPVQLDMGALGATWTLSIEEQFYVLWAPIAAFAIVRVGNPRRMILPVLVVAVALISTFWWMWPSDGIALYYRPWSRFGELLLGAVLALMLAGVRTLPRGVDRLIGVGAMAALVGFAWMRRTYPSLGAGPGNPLAAMPLAALCSALLIARLATSSTALVSRALRIRPLPYAGQLSYALYIWHVPVIVLVRTWGGGKAIAFVCTIVVSMLSYHLVEMPFLRRKAKLRTTGVDGLVAARGDEPSVPEPAPTSMETATVDELAAPAPSPAAAT